jgi:hypothetical protein
VCYSGLLGSCGVLAIKSDLWRKKRPHALSIGSQYSVLTKTDKVLILRGRVSSTISYIHESKIRYLTKVTGLGGTPGNSAVYEPSFPC